MKLIACKTINCIAYLVTIDWGALYILLVNMTFRKLEYVYTICYHKHYELQYDYLYLSIFTIISNKHCFNGSYSFFDINKAAYANIYYFMSNFDWPSILSSLSIDSAFSTMYYAFHQSVLSFYLNTTLNSQLILFGSRGN